MADLEFAGAAVRLSDQDIIAAAHQLGVEPAVIYAVDEVESAGDGFLADGRPKLLFERHVFSRETGHRHDGAFPGISNPTRGGYGSPGAHQYTRLHKAMELDRRAALRSASWGRYQVMGFNAELCGWPNVEAFVDAMTRSEAEHLSAFIGFCRANDLVRHLATHDWRSFARGYNGPGNVDEYGQRLAVAYRKHAARPPAPSQSVDAANPIALIREAQRLLGFTGAAVDGDPGPMTRAKAREYRAAHPEA